MQTDTLPDSCDGNRNLLQDVRRCSSVWWTEVTHAAASMATMSDPAKGLSTIIGGVDGSGDVLHDDLSSCSPLLDGEPLGFDVLGSRSRAAFVDHLKSSEVINVHA